MDAQAGCLRYIALDRHQSRYLLEGEDEGFDALVSELGSQLSDSPDEGFNDRIFDRDGEDVVGFGPDVGGEVGAAGSAFSEDARPFCVVLEATLFEGVHDTVVESLVVCDEDHFHRSAASLWRFAEDLPSKIV